MARAKPQPMWRRTLGVFLYSIFLSTVVVVGSFFGWAGQSQVISEVSKQVVLGTSAEEVFRNQFNQPKSHLTVLILGCDEDRTPGGRRVVNESARSDMIMVAKLNFARNTIAGVSIPRDTEARVAGYRRHRINAFHAIGGPDLAKRAVENLLGITIDRVVVLNYEAFQEAVDLLGGVELFVPKNMRYTDRGGGLRINLEKGRQVLNGHDAMGFVRYRTGESDFQRQERQRDFLLAVKEKVRSNPLAVNKVADKSVELAGGEFTPREVASLALFARTVSNENIRIGMLPVEDAGGYALQVDQSKLRETLETYGLIEDFGTLSYSRP